MPFELHSNGLLSLVNKIHYLLSPINLLIKGWKIFPLDTFSRIVYLLQ
ncbi:MAG: hypothetical protein V6013_01945 [Candidatus Dasytiphilus stammeri]